MSKTTFDTFTNEILAKNTKLQISFAVVDVILGLMLIFEGKHIALGVLHMIASIAWLSLLIKHNKKSKSRHGINV